MFKKLWYILLYTNVCIIKSNMCIGGHKMLGVEYWDMVAIDSKQIRLCIMSKQILFTYDHSYYNKSATHKS